MVLPLSTAGRLPACMWRCDGQPLFPYLLISMFPSFQVPSPFLCAKMKRDCAFIVQQRAFCDAKPFHNSTCERWRPDCSLLLGEVGFRAQLVSRACAISSLGSCLGLEVLYNEGAGQKRVDQTSGFWQFSAVSWSSSPRSSLPCRP